MKTWQLRIQRWQECGCSLNSYHNCSPITKPIINVVKSESKLLATRGRWPRPGKVLSWMALNNYLTLQISLTWRIFHHTTFWNAREFFVPHMHASDIAAALGLWSELRLKHCGMNALYLYLLSTRTLKGNFAKHAGTQWSICWSIAKAMGTLRMP